MAGRATISIIGNMARSGELRQTEDGRVFATAVIAVDRRVPDGKGGWDSRVSYFDLIAGSQASTFKALQSREEGELVYVEGIPQVKTEVEVVNGQKRYTHRFSVVVTNVTYLESKSYREFRKAQKAAGGLDAPDSIDELSPLGESEEEPQEPQEAEVEETTAA